MDKMSPCSSVFTQQDALATTHSHSIMIMKVSLVNESASIHVLRRSTESNRNGNNMGTTKPTQIMHYTYSVLENSCIQIQESTITRAKTE